MTLQDVFNEAAADNLRGSIRGIRYDDIGRKAVYYLRKGAKITRWDDGEINIQRIYGVNEYYPEIKAGSQFMKDFLRHGWVRGCQLMLISILTQRAHKLRKVLYVHLEARDRPDLIDHRQRDIARIEKEINSLKIKLKK